MPVLLVDLEDDSSSVGQVLEGAGFDVTTVSSLEGSDLGVAAFDVVVVSSGGAANERHGAVERLRSGGFTGAVLAVCRGVDDGERMVEVGADDFVTHPVGAAELLARIRSCERRHALRTTLRWGPLDLDRLKRLVRVGSREIPLTERDCDLLACLIEAGGHVVSRDELRRRVWARQDDPGTNLVEVHLSRLRDKLGADSSLIQTVRRAGYRMRKSAGGKPG